MEQGGWNLYSYIYNSPTISNDIIGLYTVSYEVNLGVIGAPFYAKIQGEIQTNPYFKVSGEFYAAWQWTIPGVKKMCHLQFWALAMSCIKRFLNRRRLGC